MRFESSVTSVSWIPREAVEGYTRLPWDLGIAHYDMPPPDTLDDLPGLLASDAARLANQLRAWVEVEDGRITRRGQAGRGLIGRTRMIAFHRGPLEAAGGHSPGGAEESPAVVTAVETAWERQLSRLIIGGDPPFRRLRTGQALVEQGEPGDELFLLFDGVLAVEAD